MLLQEIVSCAANKICLVKKGLILVIGRLLTNKDGAKGKIVGEGA